MPSSLHFNPSRAKRSNAPGLLKWICADSSRLPGQIQNVIDCTSRQVIDLRQALDIFAQTLSRQQAGNRAANLISRLLGIPTDRNQNATEADDRSAGYPLRRFAEFGLLPGYEFPALPASLRLIGEEHEEDPITVTRRFGIGSSSPMRMCTPDESAGR